MATDHPTPISRSVRRPWWHRLAPGRRHAELRRAARLVVGGDIDGAEILLRAVIGAADASANTIATGASAAGGWVAAEAWYLLGRCAAARQNPNEEQACHLRALAADAAHAEASDALLRLRAWRHRPLMEAWHQYFGGRPQDAIMAFERARLEVGARVARADLGEILGGIGWCWLDLGAPADARAVFAAAVGEAPGLVHAHKGLGVALYRLGLYAEAEAALRMTLSLAPGLADAHALMGWCAYARGEWETAVTHGATATTTNPLEADGWWVLAWSAVRLRQHERGTDGFRRAFALSPNHPALGDTIALMTGNPLWAPLGIELASALLRVGNAVCALAIVDGLAERPVPRLELETLRARALLMLGRSADARAVLIALSDAELDAPASEDVPVIGADAARRPLTLRVLRARANLALSGGLGDGSPSAAAALADATAAIARDATLATAQLVLGEWGLAHGDLTRAAAAFTAASGLPGGHDDAATGLAEVAHRRRASLIDALEQLVIGDPDRALATLAAAPPWPAGEEWRQHWLAARAHAGAGRPAEALASATAAVAASGGHPTAAAVEIKLLLAAGRVADANSRGVEAVHRNPDDPDLLEVALDAAVRAGDTAGAARLQAARSVLVDVPLPTATNSPS